MRSPVKTAAIGRPIAYALSEREQYELYKMKRDRKKDTTDKMHDADDDGAAAKDTYIFGIFKGLESGALPFVGVSIRGESNEHAIERFKEWCLVRLPSAMVHQYDFEYLRGGSLFSEDEGRDLE